MHHNPQALLSRELFPLSGVSSQCSVCVYYTLCSVLHTCVSITHCVVYIQYKTTFASLHATDREQWPLSDVPSQFSEMRSVQRTIIYCALNKDTLQHIVIRCHCGDYLVFHPTLVKCIALVH